MRRIKSLIPVNCVLENEKDILVTGLAYDSRKVETGNIFIATKGVYVDGHQYIDQAIEKGAKAVVCEELPSNLKNGIIYVKCDDSKHALSEIAKNWYGDPSTMCKLIGIGGTNGKTTIATLLFELFTQLGYKVGLISTVDYRYANKVFTATHTTPDILSLNRILSEMCDNGCDYVFMEVSSHAIHQDRLAGLKFHGAVFSNITPEHMDYHKTFKEYIYVKKKFYDHLEKDAFVLTNIDDKNGRVMVQNSKANIYTYALKRPSDYKAKVLSNMISGLVMDVNGMEAHFRLPGWYNGYNMLAVYGVADLLGENDKLQVLTIMSNLSGAEGRFDIVKVEGIEITGVIDYAHTPDALNKVIEAINELKPKEAHLISVIGCGGDRDKTKRPVMANIASSYADMAVFTSDNPRTEDPEIIIEEMEKGVLEENRSKILSITNRKQAIRAAVRMAKRNDIILVAGKGHEKYQEINDEKFAFSDRAVLVEALKMNNEIE